MFLQYLRKKVAASILAIKAQEKVPRKRVFKGRSMGKKASEEEKEKLQIVREQNRLVW